jgi:hypothetical protein
MDVEWSEFNRLSQENAKAYQKYNEVLFTATGYTEGTLDEMKAVGARQPDMDRVGLRRDEGIRKLKDSMGPAVDAALKAADDQLDRLQQARDELRRFD